MEASPRGKANEGRNSDVRLPRLAIDALLTQANGPNALALLVTLLDNLGHMPAKRFSLNHAAMAKAGLTNLSRRNFLAAHRTLEAVGLLRLVDHHRVGSRGQNFMLTRMRTAGLQAASIENLVRKQLNDRPT